MSDIVTMKATLKTLNAILEKAAAVGCEITSSLPQTKREMRGSYYITIRKEETEDCEGIDLTVRFSDHERRLSAITNHAAPDIETTDYNTAWVCEKLNEKLEWLWA